MYNFQLRYLLLLSGLITVQTSLLGLDTLQNYVALQAYTGDADTIYLDHPRYYGLFIRSDCEQEDFGTTIFNRETCWQRLHNNYSPRFWAIGGRSPDNLIGSVRQEIDALNSAAIAAYWRGGDTIEIDSLYAIDRPLFLLDHNTYLGTAEEAGLIRANPPKTVLTDTARVGDKQLKVASSAGFRTYQLINIVNGRRFDQLAGFRSYTASVSDFTPGDSIILLSGLPVQRQMLPGDTVSLFFPMMEPRFLSVDHVRIKGLTFNGNREQYNLNFDWRVNTTIQLPSTTDVRIENCRFEEITSENIFLCGATVIDCSGSDFNGSVVHFSCNEGNYRTEILYNRFSRINEIGDSVMEHTEGGMTFSARVRNVRIAYNWLEAVEENGIGTFSNDDRNNEITDNLLETEKEMVAFGNFYNQQASNLIYNNKNPKKTDRSDESCWLQLPELAAGSSCGQNSSVMDPLRPGDTLRLVLDSFQLRNSNENFLKSLIPVYDDTFFELAGMSLSTPALTTAHSWNYGPVPTKGTGLSFDNGHRDGRFAPGNWGFGPCGLGGNCRNLELAFVVRQLPDTTAAVPCPFEALEIYYDGELGSWATPPDCSKSAVVFDPDLLDSPVLAGKVPSSLSPAQNAVSFNMYPNPARDLIQPDQAVKAPAEYTILDAAGQSVQTGQYTGLALPVGNLAAGTYRILFRTENRIFSSIFTKL